MKLINLPQFWRWMRPQQHQTFKLGPRLKKSCPCLVKSKQPLCNLSLIRSCKRANFIQICFDLKQVKRRRLRAIAYLLGLLKYNYIDGDKRIRFQKTRARAKMRDFKHFVYFIKIGGSALKLRDCQSNQKMTFTSNYTQDTQREINQQLLALLFLLNIKFPLAKENLNQLG